MQDFIVYLYDYHFLVGTLFEFILLIFILAIVSLTIFCIVKIIDWFDCVNYVVRKFDELEIKVAELRSCQLSCKEVGKKWL